MFDQHLMTPVARTILALLAEATEEHVLALATDSDAYAAAGCPRDYGDHYLASGECGARCDILRSAAAQAVRGGDPTAVFAMVAGSGDQSPLARATLAGRADAYRRLVAALRAPVAA